MQLELIYFENLFMFILLSLMHKLHEYGNKYNGHHVLGQVKEFDIKKVGLVGYTSKKNQQGSP